MAEVLAAAKAEETVEMVVEKEEGKAAVKEAGREEEEVVEKEEGKEEEEVGEEA
jgi:hypothetical protein